MERNANIAFMGVLFLPVLLFFVFQNLALFREINLLRRNGLKLVKKSGSHRLSKEKKRNHSRNKAQYR